MKLILYIGHHKVGSTALQMFLAQNWVRLARNGILYPSVETRGFSSTLARALKGRDRPGEEDVNIREPHSALAYKMMSEVSEHRKVPVQFRRLPASGQMLAALQNQVRMLRPDTMILCSEAFANFGQVKPDLIRTLTRIFPKAEIEVYCALRRPDDYLISWHNQRLKVGEKIDRLSEGGAEGYFGNIHFNFRTVVEPWAQQLPQARMIVRPYGAIMAAGGSTQDFMDQVGVTFPEDMIPAGRANRSLPRAAMEIVRRANHALPPGKAHALTQFLMNSGDLLTPPADSTVEMYGADLRARLAEEFAPLHDWLSERQGGAPFFDDIAAVRAPRPLPEAEAAAQLLAQIDPAALPDPDIAAFIAALRLDTAA